MKKFLFTISLFIIVAIFSTFIISFASNITTNSKNSMVPNYDSSFNNNQGAFFANGTPITISTDNSDNTIISWGKESQIVPSTVYIFGGGNAGSNISSTSITMNSGTVAFIYGGGLSTNSNLLSNVESANITINDGSITKTLYGGGLLFTNTNSTNITINNGNINAICGGGSAAATVNGVTYAAGEEDDLLNSKNKVNLSNIIINNIRTINSESTNLSLLYGGGQGYSYVENTNIIVNNGDLSQTSITTGGSNGYTKNATLTINNGSIKFVQSVNRGKMLSSKIIINDGAVQSFYVGSEIDPTVTGSINNIEVNIIGGKITDLYAGNSNSQPLKIDQKNYIVNFLKNTVTNNHIKDTITEISLSFEIIEDFKKIIVGNSELIKTNLKTTPTGYEYLFKNKPIFWSSENENIATVDSTGTILGINSGNTIIKASLNDCYDLINVTVFPLDVILLNVIALFSIILFLISMYILIFT